MSRTNPSHPGETIQMFCLDDCGLTVAEAAAHMRVAECALAAVCEARAPITADLAIRLEMAFGGDADVWLALQKNYDLAQARKHAAELNLQIERISAPGLEPVTAD